jgi:hypothetical protein
MTETINHAAMPIPMVEGDLVTVATGPMATAEARPHIAAEFRSTQVRSELVWDRAASVSAPRALAWASAAEAESASVLVPDR